VTLPLGDLPFTPHGSLVRVRAEGIGRDSGQRIENPLPLYDMTEKLSLPSISRNWQALLD